MRGFTLLLAIGLAASDKLDRTYLPPPGAKTSGGDLGAVDAPFEVPKETPSTTIRPRPKYPVRPEDTNITVGINRGQPATVVPEGFTTPGPFSPTYIPSTTTSKAFTQATTFPPPEGFETTVSPIGPTGFPSTQRPIYGTQGPTLRPVYGPHGKVIGVTPTPATVEVCDEGNGRCQKTQQVGPVYGPKGQVISQQPTFAPTQGTVQDLRPVYGPSGEIIGVTPTPGSVEVCKAGDERCQKQAQQNVPVYGPNGQIVSYQPSVTPAPGIVQTLQPVYGPNGQIIGQQPFATPTPGTIQVYKEGDSQGQIQGQQVPVYGPSGQIVGYQPSFKPTPGAVQSPSTQGQQTIPVYGPNGKIVGYQPSVVQSPGLQPIYGPLGQIIGQQPIPTPSSVQTCNEDDERCLNEALKNVPVYGPNGKIIGYQPNEPTPQTVQSPSTTQGQQIIPVYGPNGEIIGYQPSATPTSGPAQNLQPVYDSKGKIIEYRPTGLVQGCKEGDLQCQKQAQQFISAQQPSIKTAPGTVSGLQPVYDSNGKIIEYRPTGLVQGCKEEDLQCQQRPIYGTQGPTLRPVYGPDGKVIGVTPTPATVEVCEEGNGRCQKTQEVGPVYGPKGQVISQQPTFAPTQGTVQDLRPVYGPSGEIIGVTPTPGSVEVCKAGDERCQKQAQQNVPVYGPNGQIVNYQPSVTPAPGTVQSLQPVYGPNGQIIGQQPVATPTPGTIQVYKEGDSQGQIQGQPEPVYGPSGQIVGYQPSFKLIPGAVQRPSTQGQQTIPVYGPNGKIVGYQPSVVQSPGLQPIYGPLGQIIGQQPVPTPTSVQTCNEGDERCLNEALKNVPVYGPNGKIIGYQPNKPTPGTVQSPSTQGQQIIPVYGPHGKIIGYQPSASPTSGPTQNLQPVYDSNGKIIEYRPTGLVQGCKEGDVQCQKQAQLNKLQPSVTSTPGTFQGLQPVYDSNGKLIDYRPIGLVQGCKEGDLLCQKQAQQYTPVYENRQQPTVTPTPGFVQGLQPVYDSNGKIIEYRPTGLVQGCNEGDVQCQKQAQTDQTISQQPSVSPTPGQQIVPVYGPNGQIIGQRPALSPTPGTEQALQPTYSPSGQYVGQQPTPGAVQLCQAGDENCQKQVQQNVPVYGSNGQIVGYQPSVTPTPGSVQTIQPTYGPGQKLIPTPTQGIVQVCQNGDEGCQKLAEQNVPVYGPNGQIVGYQPGVTSSPGAAQDIQPVYDSNGKIYGYRPTGLVQGCKEGDVQCQKQTQQIRPVYGPNGQIIGQQVTPSPETVQSLRPVYGPDGKVIAHTPTVAPTTSRPVYGGKVYQPGSTVKPSVTVTTPSYYRPSSIGTTPAPFRNLVTTPAGVVISSVGPDTERPLAESDKKAVTINYDVSITPDGYSFNFDTSNGIHVDETSRVKPDGNKAIGSYSYIGDDGKEYHVSYEADENGFKPTGDHLPTPPPIPPEIQRVIEQAAKDKQAGISDDGSYDEVKYGPDRYDRPHRPQSGEIQRPTTGRKPSKQSYDKNGKPEEGYQYAPPKPKFHEGSNRFPPRLPSRGDSRRPPGSDKKSTKQPFITPNVHRDNQDSYEEGPYGQRFIPGKGKQTPRPTDENVSEFDTKPEDNNERPGGIRIPSKPKSRPNVTTYRPSGIVRPGQVDKYGRPISSQPGEVIGSTTYRPSERPQSQVDKFGRPIIQQPGEYVIDENGQPIQVDEYGRPTSLKPGQGYSSTTYRPTGTSTPGQVDAFGRPVAYTPGKAVGSTPSTQVDEYGRPISSRPGEVIGSTTYRPSERPQSQIDKFGRPIIQQPGEYFIDENGQPIQVDEYGRPTSLKPGQGYSSTTYRPTGTSAPGQVDAFGRPVAYSPGEAVGSTPSTQVDEYGRPISSRPGEVIGSTTYRPSERPQSQVDKFGRPIIQQPGEYVIDKNGQPIQVDEYGRPTSLKPGQGYSSTTYRPTGTSAPGQVDAFGRPVAYTPDEAVRSTPSTQVDEYGRPISSRPGQLTGVTIQPNQVDKFGRPVYSQPGDKPSGTAETSQVDKYGRPIPSRPEKYSPTYSSPDTTGSGLLDTFGRPVSKLPKEIPGSTPSPQVDAYGRPVSSRPGQRPSSTYRPVETAEPGSVDTTGSPVTYTPGQPTGTTPSTQVNYRRPVSSRPRQQPSSTTYRPVSSTQEPEYQPDSGISGPGGKPGEFGPKKQRVGPEYLSPREDKNGQFIGEDFRGPKQPQRYDPKTGYHY